MDLIARLRNWALARPRVLLVDVPGATTLRWSVEAELDRRGWRCAVSPADTDLLVILGDPRPELAGAVDVLWSQVPEPRHRMSVHDPGDVVVALDAGRESLVRRAGSVVDGDDRPSPGSMLGKDEGMDHEGMDHEGMDHGGEVAGLPMAMTGPDRDGLELDVLKVVLGPVLPGWPTGLLLRADLRGDVLTSAEPAWLDAHSPTVGEPDPRRAALDRLARFLDVAGWPTAARDARRARDGRADGAHRDGAHREEAQRLAAAVARRVRRSRTLAWTAGGIGRTPAERGPGGGVLHRVRRWCDIASGQPADGPPGATLDDVAALVEGTELGSARLIVASLDLSPVPTGPAPEHLHA
jgi:hypothetical protein